MPEIHDPILFDGRGLPISREGSLLAPNALNFAQIITNIGKMYSFRFDEAMRDNPQNALAMKRDAFYLALLQERNTPTINTEFEVFAEYDEEDPMVQLQVDTLNRCWRQTPDLIGLKTSLCEAHWYGRSGSQLVWGPQPGNLKGVVFHEPVNGDSMQFQWDNTPAVLVSWYTSQRYRAIDKLSIIPGTDRGTFALRLYKPEYRRRFVIHKFVRSAADYFEGELAGGVHGVGLRHWAYWTGWLKTETITWMLNFMQAVGMMDLIIFNYAQGNEPARAAQEANAKKINNKITFLVPRDPKEKYPAVEQFSVNVQGLSELRTFVAEYLDKHLERLFVGQSMSAGADHSEGLGGTGRAKFAQDTKEQLLELDANRLAETLKNDWLIPARDYNFPGSDFALSMRAIRQDPLSENKMKNLTTITGLGIEVEVEEARNAAGFKKPRPGKPVIGTQVIQQPGQDNPGFGDQGDQGEQKGFDSFGKDKDSNT